VIVGLGHQARVGKDTAAQFLVAKHGFIRLAFADRLKRMALDLDPVISAFPRQTLREVVEERGWEDAKQVSAVRVFLQRLGVAARDHLGSDVWVHPVLDEIIPHRHEQDFVVTDVRFPNEFRGLRELGAVMVKITRDGYNKLEGHVSETALLGYDWDLVIENNGSVEELEGKLALILSYLRRLTYLNGARVA
jgi:hypothetical protein